MVALILFNKSAHGDKYRKIICSRFLPPKFDFRLVCNVGLHESSGSEHLRHVVETSAEELPTSACVSDFRFTACSLCLPKHKCHKSTKKSTHAPQNALSIRVHLHDRSSDFHPFGFAELSSGLEIVPGPCRTSMSTRTTEERLLGAGEKNVSHMCRPPRLISSFRVMMWWENYLASSNSEHTRQKASLVCLFATLMQPSCCWSWAKTLLWTHDHMLNLHEHGQTTITCLSPQKS